MAGGSRSSLLDPAYRRLTTGMILVVTFIAFEAIGVATVLPVVQVHLGDLRLYGWVFSAFMLAQLVGTVVAGRVLDRAGMARPLLAASVLFGAGILVDGSAPSMLVLVLGRAVQGVGAGIMVVTINVAVGRGFPPALRPKVYAALSTAWVLPSVAGPLVAAVIAEHLTWRLVFLAVVPAVVLGAALALPALHQADADTAARRAGTDAAADDARPGVRVALVLAAGAALVLEALATRQAVAGPIVGVAGVVLAVPALRAILPKRSLPPATRQLGAMAVAALANAAFFGAEAFLPLSLRVVHHRSVTEAGVVLTVAALTWTSGSWVQARFQDRVGPRALSAAGLALVATGVAGVAVLDWAATPWWVAYAAWAVAGAGMGLAYATTTLVVVSAAGEGRQGGPMAAMQVLVTLGVALSAGVGGAALAWSVSLGHGKAPGLAVFDVTAVALALVGLGLTTSVPRTVPGSAPGPRPATMLPGAEGAALAPDENEV